MGPHAAIVHYAPPVGKCLLHRGFDYSQFMETPNSRLRKARIDAGFDTQAAAAAFLGVSVDTYRQHENDTRNLGGIPRKAAMIYARKFKVSLDWLMTGRGAERSSDGLPSEGVLQEMVRELIDAEVTMQTKLADLPRIVASGLSEQLERYQADPKVADFWAEKLSRDKGSRSRPATTRSEKAG